MGKISLLKIFRRGPTRTKILYAKYFKRRIIRFTAASCSCEMALLHYMKPIDGLPDPRGSLSSCISSQAIAEANKEVQKAKAGGTGKRGPYTKYSANSSC